MSVAESDVRPASAPARSRVATRRRLVEAATELFAAHGLHGVTSARIARAAGVATGTFYLHFKDKQELFREIVLTALAELRERQDRAAEGSAPGSRAELRARLTELLAFGQDHGDLIRVAFGRGAESTTIGDEVMDQIVPGLEQAFLERRIAGELEPEAHPAVAAQAVAAMMTRVLAWWVEDPTRASRDDVTRTLLALHPSRPRR